MENPFSWNVVEHFGEKMHEGVHALIEREGKFLLLDRRFYPFGYQCVAGHIDRGEKPEHALQREMREELGVSVTKMELLFSALQGRGCPFIWYKHFNYIYRCQITGAIKLNFESKNYGWFSEEEIKNLKLTHFTRKIFQDLKII